MGHANSAVVAPGAGEEAVHDVADGRVVLRMEVGVHLEPALDLVDGGLETILDWANTIAITLVSGRPLWREPARRGGCSLSRR